MEALKGIIRLCEVPNCSGNMTNRLRTERILGHLGYSKEDIAMIMAKFSKAKFLGQTVLLDKPLI